MPINDMFFLLFIDPPTEVRMTTPSEIENKVKIKRGFGEYLLEASAESYTAFSCSSVMITWVSSRNGIIMFCQAKGKDNFTMFTPFIYTTYLN